MLTLDSYLIKLDISLKHNNQNIQHMHL